MRVKNVCLNSNSLNSSGNHYIHDAFERRRKAQRTFRDLGFISLSLGRFRAELSPDSLGQARQFNFRVDCQRSNG